MVFPTILTLLLFASPYSINFEKKIRQFIELDDLEEALNLCNQLIKEDGDNTEILSKRGHLYLKLYEYDRALSDFKKILRLDSKNIQGHLGMAKYHAYKFQIIPAMGYLESSKDAVLNDDDQLQYLAAKGEILMQFNLYVDAEKTLFEAISIKPDNYELIDLFVQSLDRQGKDNEVLEYINMVSSDLEMTPYSLAKMGQLMNRIEFYSEANLYLEQALNMDPDHSDALCYMAFTYMRLNKTKEALKKIEKSINHNPLKALSYRIRAELLGKMEKYPRACKDLQRAISLDVEENLIEELAELSTTFCH